jgi:hypothetical protein
MPRDFQTSWISLDDYPWARKRKEKKTEIAIAGAASHVPLASSMAGGAGCTSRTDGGVPPAAFPGTDADAARLTEKEGKGVVVGGGPRHRSVK